MEDASATADKLDGKSIRYRSRPANGGWIVLDTWTGEPAQIGGLAQTGLSQIDADHTAAMLESRSAQAAH
jgi:hypothetical protein